MIDNLKNKDANTKHIDLIIDDIPEKQLVWLPMHGQNIISRIPLILDTVWDHIICMKDFVDNVYFHPISLNNLTIHIDNERFISFET